MTGRLYLSAPSGSTKYVRVTTGLGTNPSRNARARTTSPFSTGPSGGIQKRPGTTVRISDRSVDVFACSLTMIDDSYAGEASVGTDPSSV